MTATRRLTDISAQGDVPAAAKSIPLDGPEPGIVQTPSHKKVHQGCAYAQHGALVLIYGGAGVGKTTAAARYVNNHQECGKTAYHINLLGVKSPASMLQTIAEGVRSPGSFGAYRNVSLMRALADYFNPGDLLILDEAQFLRPDALDAARFFLDERGVGLVLMGNELIFSTIAGKNRRAVFAQLHSRVGMRLHLPHPTEEDADAVLSAWGVSENSGRDYGRQLALGPGGLRQLAQVLRQARIAAAATRQALDHRLMHAAASALGLTD